MPKEKKKKKKEVELTPAEKYAKLLALKKSVKCIIKDQDVYEVYRKLEKNFLALEEEARKKEDLFEGIDTCAQLSAECKNLADELEPKLPKEKVVDSRTVTTTVKEQENAGEKKKSNIPWLLIIILALLIAGVVSWQFPQTHSLIASGERALGFLEEARNKYESLGDYQKVAEVEKQEIEKAKVGDKVQFGKCKWVVINKDKAHKLLMKADSIFRPFDDKAEKTATNWEKSSIRTWLNSEFIKENFNEEEIKLLLDNDVDQGLNNQYPDKSDNTSTIVKDKIYILSIKDFKKYKGILEPGWGRNMRLRDHGRDLYATCFVTNTGKISHYGVPANEPIVSIKPIVALNVSE